MEKENIKWKNDIKKMHENGCTDSDIRDYVNLHFTELNEKEVWNFIDELNFLESQEFIDRNIRKQIENIASKKGITFEEELEIIKIGFPEPKKIDTYMKE